MDLRLLYDWLRRRSVGTISVRIMGGDGNDRGERRKSVQRMLWTCTYRVLWQIDLLLSYARPGEIARLGLSPHCDLPTTFPSLKPTVDCLDFLRVAKEEKEAFSYEG